ncbi:helix-turn-helix transcriptional regulator [Xenorhabdus bovienii]|uniref:Helix-turn-helix transcriptional regulator n=1 Tax=Xenorhabdus bovienii TaxID=40576 RepID=A0AAJ1J975_XENBV|nr:helix-turn-helix transcriptional regulator [Xenorhabdus bovienii]MDE1479434.1 helix-turn-helix transcriptional regulator [Xenorhabdus bovienii]MDE9511085.1 helix-turn-helix transcriptional regulator [Xenorhabdus bovienii]MDE9519697.1 helix-turn-helix transcriptional regulator [Xenorhabdus bovienii]MDE9522742.1 helix-turn-helix transcriptional regulator [Xenorhabdus bovienii]MDE9537148.1 helix-turn-helix transcriptional regulator [Xenorhabdus bovienii]
MQTPLRKIRLDNKLKIAEVAAAVDCDVGNLSRLERGSQNASLEMAEKLSRFYNGMIDEMQILYPQRYM